MNHTRPVLLRTCRISLLVVGALAALFCWHRQVTAGTVATPLKAAEPWHFRPADGVWLAPLSIRQLGLASEVVPDDAPLVLPARAVLQTVRGSFAYVQNGDHWQRTPLTVEPGPTADQITVRNGLWAGDLVVTDGTEALWLIELQASNGGAACTHGH